MGRVVIKATMDKGMDTDLVNKLILELQMKMGKEHREYVQALEVIRAHINMPDEVKVTKEGENVYRVIT
jgi:hypothetical protein